MFRCPFCRAKIPAPEAGFCRRCGKPFGAGIPSQKPDTQNVHPRQALQPGSPRRKITAGGGPVRARLASGIHRVGGLSKPLLFAVFGGVGCFLGAVLGEVLMAMLPPPPNPVTDPRPVDVLFTLDVTGSMAEELHGVQRSIDKFSHAFLSRGMETRVGLIAFGDRFVGEEPVVLSFDGSTFSSNPAEFEKAASAIHPVDGGDDPESSMDAVLLATEQDFRPDAVKVIIHITDAPFHTPDRETRSAGEIASALHRNGISQVNFVVPEDLAEMYHPLRGSAGGAFYPISRAARGEEGFEAALPEIGARIAESIGGVNTRRTLPSEASSRVRLILAAWTAALAVALASALIAGQNWYLRRPFLPTRDAGKALIGGLLAGGLAGVIGQTVFELLSVGGDLALYWRGFSWLLLGGLMGWGMSLFVPNLDRKRAIIGGTVGGLLGAIGFHHMAALYGDVSGRWAGAAVLGFMIGLMIALMEVAGRRAWLELTFDNGAQRQVSLGRDPVAIGSDERNAVFVRSAPATALVYSMESDRVTCREGQSGRIVPVAPGEQRSVGGVTIVLRSG